MVVIYYCAPCHSCYHIKGAASAFWPPVLKCPYGLCQGLETLGLDVKATREAGEDSDSEGEVSALELDGDNGAGGGKRGEQ